MAVRCAQTVELTCVEIVGCQRLECHGADVHAAQLASGAVILLVRVIDGPVAVGLLLVNQQVNPCGPGRVARFIPVIIAGIQGNESPDGAVVALLRDLIGVAAAFGGLVQQRLHQIVGFTVTDLELCGVHAQSG